MLYLHKSYAHAFWFQHFIGMSFVRQFRRWLPVTSYCRNAQLRHSSLQHNRGWCFSRRKCHAFSLQSRFNATNSKHLPLPVFQMNNDIVKSRRAHVWARAICIHFAKLAHWRLLMNAYLLYINNNNTLNLTYLHIDVPVWWRPLAYINTNARARRQAT